MRFVALALLVLLSACAGVPPPVPPDPVPVVAPTVPAESVAQAPEPVTMCQLPFGKYSRGEKFASMTCPVYKQAIANAVSVSTSPDLWFCWIMDECFFWEHEQRRGK